MADMDSSIKETQQVQNAFNPELIKNDFPIFSRQINGKKLIYLDNAATTQKPEIVINTIDSFYRLHNANVHRGLHTLAEEATEAFEQTRKKVAEFIGSVKTSEIIYTRGTTEAINLVAQSWGRANVGPGDSIVITQMEHHANLVPWLMLARRTGAELRYIPIDSEGYLALDNIDKIITDSTKILAITHMSNVLGTINPVEQLIKTAHKKGAVVLIDGAQGMPHLPVNVKTMDCDFYAFSAHKMLGPTGFGILYGKKKLLDSMEPIMFGGEMISKVQYDNVEWNVLPYKFEAGTPDIAGAVGLAPALDYLSKLGMESIRRHEIELTAYALQGLAELNFIKVFGPKDVNRRGGVISFIDKDIHPHDLATVLDSHGIAVRAGHHCAQPLTQLLGKTSTARASFYIYNTKTDVDELITGLLAARRFFGHV
jgi:cysteine desulfurase/selenocysteine lyase